MSTPTTGPVFEFRLSWRPKYHCYWFRRNRVLFSWRFCKPGKPYALYEKRRGGRPLSWDVSLGFIRFTYVEWLGEAA